MVDGDDDADLTKEAAALVYGLGRASGIRIVPHHVNTTADITRLATNVLAAGKEPPDEDLGDEVAAAAAALKQLVAATAPAPELVEALDVYIRARMKSPNTAESVG
jgi:hypothetical protein